jgi:hypothetical protein
VVGAIQSLSNLTDGHKMLSRDFAERILGNANKIFMSLESTQTALEAERYWGEEITRKQSYQTSEGYTDSGRYLSPMRYLNPQRSRNLQDRRGWIEGWEPRIKADEFIHGLGIGEAYLRHNGRPAKVNLIRADINPPADFDLSADLPRFSQGNEPPLNLTEKVNRVVMERMREAKREKAKDDTKNTVEDRRSNLRKHKRKAPTSPVDYKESISTDTEQRKVPEFVNQSSGFEETTQTSPTTQAPQVPPTHVASGEEPVSRSSLRKQENPEWYGSWEED